MLLTDEEVQERIESPMNLLNRLKSASQSRPSSPLLPSSKDLIENLDEKLQLGTVRSKAAAIMSTALDELKERIPDIEKPEKLAQIAAEMNKVLISRQDERDKPQHQIIVYAPQVIHESNFESIVVNE